MKKMMLLLAAVFLTLSLTACGGTGKQSASATPPPAKQESMADLFSKGKNLPGLTYDYVMTLKDGPGMTGKVWVSGKKMKTETLMEKQQMITFIDSEANVIHNYMPAQAMLIKVPLDPSKTDKSPDQYAKSMDSAKVKFLENAVYDGVKCKVVVTEDQSSQTKLWVREDYGIPMKVEFSEAGHVTMRTDYKNITVGPVPPETFALPKGISVTDMSEMVKNLPKP